MQRIAFLLTGVLLALPAAAEEFEAARTYTLDRGKLTVEVGRPALFQGQGQTGVRYALHLPLRVENRLGRTIALETTATTVLDRLDHPLAEPSVFLDGAPVTGEAQIANRQKVIVELVFEAPEPVRLDRFDLHWAFRDRGDLLQEITHYRVQGALPGAERVAAPSAASAAAPGAPPGTSPQAAEQAAASLAAYHFYRDLMHGDLLGASLNPPSGMTWVRQQAVPKELPLEIDVLGF